MIARGSSIARALGLACLVAAQACGSDERSSPNATPTQTQPADASADTTPQAPPLTFPSPSTNDCTASCARLEVLGPAVELSPPFEDSGGAGAVTFGASSWYVAWGGRPSNVTQLQRLTGDGQLDGPTKQIDGTTPRALAWSTRNGGELDLIGWVPPAYSAAGIVLSVQRFTPALAPAGEPFLLRGPGSQSYGEWASERPSGALSWANILNRPQLVAREIEIDPAAGASQTATQRDWFLSSLPTSGFAVIERFGDERFVADIGGGKLRVTALDASGAIGTPNPVLDLPETKAWGYVVLSARTSDRWWVGAYPAQQGTKPIVLRALDAATRAPVGDPIRIDWPGEFVTLYAAEDTLLLTGDLSPVTAAAPVRTTFVPIDPKSGAACRGSRLSVTTNPEQYQMARTVHFDGKTAGAVVDVWAGTPNVRRMLFTRLACKPAR